MSNNQLPPHNPFPVEGDNVIVNQSWLNNIGLLVALIAAVLGTIYCMVLFPEYTGVPLPDGTTFPLLAVVPIAVALRWLAVMLNNKLVLTPEYLLLISGAISWRKTTTRLEYHRISEIEIVQTIPQRLFGIGDVIVMPAGTGPDASVCMPGVSYPGALKDILRYRQHHQPAPDTNPGGE
jgi:uncharacterized membrane protein YdbT with pleckstrin-like domain